MLGYYYSYIKMAHCPVDKTFLVISFRVPIYQFLNFISGFNFLSSIIQSPAKKHIILSHQAPKILSVTCSILNSQFPSTNSFLFFFLTVLPSGPSGSSQNQDSLFSPFVLLHSRDHCHPGSKYHYWPWPRNYQPPTRQGIKQAPSQGSGTFLLLFTFCHPSY